MLMRQAQQRLVEASAEQASVGLREERLRELVAAAGGPVVEGVVEGVFPRLHASVHVAYVRGDEQRAEREQHDSYEREREPAGGHVQKREEGAEEHQRGAELTREQQRHHGCAPHDEHRSEVLHRRDRQA